jgi:hypothetical protein
LCFLFLVKLFFISMKRFNEAKVKFKAKLKREPDLTTQID